MCKNEGDADVRADRLVKVRNQLEGLWIEQSVSRLLFPPRVKDGDGVMGNLCGQVVQGAESRRFRMRRRKGEPEPREQGSQICTHREDPFERKNRSELASRIKNGPELERKEGEV